MRRGGKSLTVVLFCVAAAATLRAQTFTTLFTFDGKNGEKPSAPLLQGFDGNFYGTTASGGLHFNGGGTIFQLTPSGTMTILYSFCGVNTPRECADGYTPEAALTQTPNGYLYGTTETGGDTGYGTVFEFTPSGFKSLYSFCSPAPCTGGSDPIGALLWAPTGNFYGTTLGGGVSEAGTFLKMTAGGVPTTLHDFCLEGVYPTCADGAGPTGVIPGTDGNFYGTTIFGGPAGDGTVFKITPGGTLTTLYSFCSQSGCADGTGPNGVIQGADGNFYETTNAGGAPGFGTVFKLTASGTLTTLHTFCLAGSPCIDGGTPLAGLVQATDGNLYGTTSQCVGLTAGCKYPGTIFQITPSGTFTTLYIFCSAGAPCTDGADPGAALIQGTDGNLYGSTTKGSGSAPGTIFRLSVGLAPFVKALPGLGTAGTVVRILGNNLTGTTSVTFNGTAASFSVATNTLIEATVPAGASTGEIQVVTPSGTLSSNTPFRVEP